MVNFSGKWVFDRADNMEAVAKKLQVNPANVPKDRSTTVEINQQGDTFNVKTTAANNKTRDVTFSIGQPFVDQDIKEMRGVDVQVTPSWDGDKLVMTGTAGNWGSRELVGGQMVVTISYEGVVGKRFFNKA